MKVKAESFHLNGHIIEFRLQTQKLESPHKTPSNTLAVKGLKRVQRFEKITGFVNKVHLHDAGIFSPSAMVIGFRSHLVVAWFVSPGL